MREVFPNVYKNKGKLFTRDLKSRKWREWKPYKSKIAAGMMKGLKLFPVLEGNKVLYLGSAQGTTVSHLSDIVGEKGLVVGVDVSSKAMQSFIVLAEQRGNIVPVLSDANNPKAYSEIGEIRFDLLCQDVAQKNQAEILVKNSVYLKEKGYGLLSLKIPAISQSRRQEEVVEKEKKVLEKAFRVLEEVNLVPYEKKHWLLLLRKK